MATRRVGRSHDGVQHPGLGDAVSDAIAAGVGLLGLAVKYTSVGGVCKPTTQGSLDAFKEMQRQVNRVLSAKKVATIPVDGDIGPVTIAAVQQIQYAAKTDLQAGLQPPNAATALALVATSTCSGIANAVVTIAANAKTYADQLGASSAVASPAPAKTPAYVNPSTGAIVGQPMTASLADAWSRLGTTTQLAAVGIVGGIGYFMFVAKKPRRTTRRS